MKKRLLTLLFVLMIIAVLLVSCNNPSIDETPPNDSTSGESVSDTVAPMPDMTEEPADTSDLTLIANGEVLYRVVRSDKLDVTHPHVAAAKEICYLLGKVIGDPSSVRLYTDWSKDGEYDHNTVEVLVGITNYSESEEVLKSVKYGEYAVRVVDKKLVVAAHTDEAIQAAVKELSRYVSVHAYEGTITFPADLNLSGVTDESLADIPTFEGGFFETSYLCGGGGVELIISDTDTNEYNAYLKTLENAGYECVTSTVIAKNEFATYENKELTLNVGYYNYEKSARIVIEDRVEHHPFVKPEEYTAVTTSSVTMLGCAYNKSDGTLVGNGLSMVIRVEDGSFIVVDGSHQRTQARDCLLKALDELSKDYRKDGEKIRIAAWIITHPHSDHYGMFRKYYADIAKKCTVDTVIANIADISEIKKGHAAYPDNDIGESDRGASIIPAAKGLGALLHTARVGETYYFAGAKLEMLFTIDAYGPKVINAINTTSLVAKMTFKDGTSLMITGDATGNGMEICAKMYSLYLKSDIVQVTHHGAGTWGNNNGVIMAYKIMRPSLVLYPAGDTTFKNSHTKSYNVALFSPTYAKGGSNDNFKEVFVGGHEYNATTTPIPYVEGTTYKWKLK